MSRAPFEVYAMTDFRLVINSENAAFADGNAAAETARIVREVARAITNGSNGGAVHDANGNKCGNWYFDAGDANETDED